MIDKIYAVVIVLMSLFAFCFFMYWARQWYDSGITAMAWFHVFLGIISLACMGVAYNLWHSATPQVIHYGLQLQQNDHWTWVTDPQTNKPLRFTNFADALYEAKHKFSVAWSVGRVRIERL